MLNIKCVQKHARGHRYQQSPNTGQRVQSLKRAQRRGLRWNPKESTYARVGRCNQGKRALVKPEGSTYAGARSARERQERAKFWTNCKGWWPLKEVFIRKPNLRQIRSARKTLKQFQSRRWNVWNVKLHPPQIPLSLSWLGEAKTAQKSAKSRQSEAQPGDDSSAIPGAAQSRRQQKPRTGVVSTNERKVSQRTIILGITTVWK